MYTNTFSKLLRLVVLVLISAVPVYAATSLSGLKPGSHDALALSNTDYSNANTWLSFGGDKRKGVDVFAIYPTVTSSAKEADKPFIRIGSPLMRKRAAEWLSQTEGVVSEFANIYAPMYRQLNGNLLDDLDSTGFANYTNAIPRDDIFAAFAYYLDNINKGERPFILFGQSQGAQLVIELATTFLGNERYYTHNTNHIIAYAIGCSVTSEQIAKNPNLKFSQTKQDTGVIVSWNTTAPSEVASRAYASFGTWKPGALMTNPISWETHETLAHASKNNASRLDKPDGTFELVQHYANALADKEHSILVTTTVDEAGYTSMSTKVSKFHAFDLAFYYESVKRNVQDRIAAFRAQ